MSAPAVSVVLPCFNGADTLSAAIDSILGQTCEDWELIVFDDGSTDLSHEIACRYASLDTRIHPIASPHIGIVAALQQACAFARGAYIARMDADDVSYPERLAKQVALLEAEPAVALCGTQVVMTGPKVKSGLRRYERWVNRLTTPEDLYRELFVECPVPHPTFMIRRAVFRDINGYQDKTWAEDYDLCMRLFIRNHALGKVPEVLLEWRNMSGRLSALDPRYSPESFRALKRYYLAHTYLRNPRPFYQWGAGDVGKSWLRERLPPLPEAVVDVNPRKLGRTIHGIKVIPPDGLPRPGEAFVGVTVGARGARREIRAWFNTRGYTEQEDYLFLA